MLYVNVVKFILRDITTECLHNSFHIKLTYVGFRAHIKIASRIVHLVQF